MTKCRGCAQEIDWIKTKAGKLMPVDIPAVTVVTKEGEIITGQISHFATGPKADIFRKK